MKAKIRKLVTVVEETRSEMDNAIEPPTRRAAAIAVIENPFAGRYVEDLARADRYRRGTRRACWRTRAVAALGIEGSAPKATAKRPPSAKTASSNTPPRFCTRSSARRFARFWARVQRSIPSSKKRGGPGVALDVPLGHKDAAFVRSHFDGMEVRIADAPARQRDHGGGRGHRFRPPVPRVGGLTKNEIKGDDGLR